MEKSKLMRLNEVLSETKMAKTKLYRLIGQGRFPKQIKHGDGNVIWARVEVEYWIDCLISGIEYEHRKAA
jgi:prophage regulatory protein